MIDSISEKPFFFHDKNTDTYWIDIGWSTEIGFNPQELKELCAEAERLLAKRNLTFID